MTWYQKCLSMAGHHTPLQPPQPFCLDTQMNGQDCDVDLNSSMWHQSYQKTKKNTLLYSLDEETDNVLTSTDISEKIRKQYDHNLMPTSKYARIRISFSREPGLAVRCRKIKNQQTSL